MANEQEKKDQRQGLPKMLGLKDEPYYANCTMLETTPFDVAILFGKVRPTRDANGQGQLVEMYDRQVYLSHLQARALYEGLGRSLSSLSSMIQQSETEESMPESPIQETLGNP